MSAKLLFGLSPLTLVLRAVILALAMACFLALSAGQARSESSLSCGDTITEDTTLDSDLVDCPGDGIVVGADRITIDLNGHTISGRFDHPCTDDCVHQDGIDNTAGHDRVVIENGIVRNFENGVRLDGAKRNELDGLRIERFVVQGVPGTGIYLSNSDRNRVLDTEVSRGDPAILLSDSDRNTISDSSADGGISIRVGDGIQLVEGSDDNRLTDNTIRGAAMAVSIADSRRNVLEANDASAYGGNVLLRAERTVIVGNTLGGGHSDGLLLRESDGNRIESNTVPSAFGNGIVLDGDRNLVEANTMQSTQFGGIDVLGAGNVVRANSVGPTGYLSDGIRVEAGSTATLVEGNVATEAGDDGIDVEASGTLVRRNLANDNGDFGIEAVEGVIDGGGNRASGNGNPLQCLNVFCD